MSWETENWARQQRTGHPVTKAVLVGIANWMNPRGDPCQVSLRRLADEVEVSVRTVQRYVQILEGLGLVVKDITAREDGGQGWNTFRFPTYKPSKVSHVPPAGKRAKPHDNLTPPHDNLSCGEGDRLSPGEGDNLTGGGCHPCHGPHDTAVTPESEERSVINPPLPPQGGGEVKAKHDRGSRIPEAWTPPPISELPKTAQAKVRQWPDGAYEAEAEAFRDYWLGEGRAGARKLDWNRAWCNRINEVTARVLRDAKAGVKFDYAASADRPAKVTPALDNSGECAAARAIRERLSRAITPGSFNAWITPTRFDIAGQTLTVTAPSDMMSGYIQGNFDTDIRRALAAELGKAASLRWRVERPPSRRDDISPTE